MVVSPPRVRAISALVAACLVLVAASATVNYPPPKDWSYDTVSAPSGIDENKINVHLVPHTHDDTGWQVTVDQYFTSEVYYVVDTVVTHLLQDPNRRFIYVEIGFFARWWDEQPERRKNETRQLVKEGRLEFINGGWCMHDEASPFYVEMIDQTTRGHQFLVENFGEDARPRGTWQIDPFGHSNTQAWLLGAEAGMESLFWGRTDYQDSQWRQSTEGKKENHWLEWIWRGSRSMGASADVFAGELTTGGYGAPIHFDRNTDSQVQDDPRRHDYNLDQQVDAFINAAIKLQNNTKGNHQMWPCGSDFQYQNADHWYRNLDKLIHYVNVNASRGGPVKAMYSTPTVYTTAKKAKGYTWEVRKQDDIFPLADNSHNYWSGYFTSRPALKRQVRAASNFLNAARQLEVITGVNADNVTVKTERPSPVVGKSWTDSLEGTVGVATHHDGMSGTERQDVTDDYSQRISESAFEVEAGVAKSLSKLLGGDIELGHCNCNMAGDCLNISICSHTTGKSEFTMVAWNPLAQQTNPWINVPVTGADWTVTLASSGASVASQTVPMEERTLLLPELYLNAFGMNANEQKAARAALANNATHQVTFKASLPPVGYTTFHFKQGSEGELAESAAPAMQVPTASATVSNGVYEIAYDAAAGTLTSITNTKSGLTSPFNIEWGFYKSSSGGCTGGVNQTTGKYDYKLYGCSGQASGAYIFRPNSTEVYPCGPGAPTLNVTKGPIVTELMQTYGSWCTHVLRMRQGDNHIEVEWTAGPVPQGQPWIPTPPPPPPPTGQCLGWEAKDGNKKSCSDKISFIEEGQCKCGAGTFTPPADPKRLPFTCNDACAGRTCVGWHQTANCGSADEPKNFHGCDYELETPASGYCVCSMGHTVGGHDWLNWGCGLAKGGSCNDLCAGVHKDNWGKEVIMRYSTNVANKGRFYTDANGREMAYRMTNGRGPSYPPYVVNEPVAGNYYPVNSMISLNDDKAELAVVVDTSLGGASLKDGQLELMVHRRVMVDDHRGVQEPLNETMCGCNDINAAPGAMGAHGHEADGGCECAGLTMRGKHFVIYDTPANADALRRQLIETLNFAPTLAFAQGTVAPTTPTFSALSAALPTNIKLLTLTSNYAAANSGKLLLRLAHMYSVEENTPLAQPASLKLSQIFGKTGLTIASAEEMSLTANRPAADLDAITPWRTEEGSEKVPRKRVGAAADGFPVTIGPMEIKTFLVTFA